MSAPYKELCVVAVCIFLTVFCTALEADSTRIGAFHALLEAIVATALYVKGCLKRAPQDAPS